MKLFKKLASIYSGSDKEEPMRRYIKRWIRSCVRNVSVKTDEYGNMYITKGEAETYPCVVAHLDQVQDKYPADYKAVETPDIIFGYSPSNRRQCGLGADDKCGIWIALKMLKKHDAIKIAFFPGEEIGCVGSSKADMSFFDDVRFVIEPDRRGSSDLITVIGGTELCSEDFLYDISYKDFGYKPRNGMMTDVETLKIRGLKASCINMSCGYYNPHTEDEYIVKADLVNAMNFVDNVIENCTDVYTHEPKERDDYYSYKRRMYEADDYYWYDKKYYTQSINDTVEEDYPDLVLEEYELQLADAEDFLRLELKADPNMTPESFMASYGQELHLLTLKDIEEIFMRITDEYYEEEHMDVQEENAVR